MTRIPVTMPVRHLGRTVLFVLLSLLLVPALQAEENKAETGTTEALPKVLIHTSEGTMELELRPDIAPETVANFLSYVDSGFYNGTIFHRVIPSFMIQGGGFTPELARKPTNAPIQNEASPSLGNQRGTIAMARTNAPHSATSQFFINLVDNPYLNAGTRGPGYAVFGKVTSGMSVADSIAGVDTGRRNGMGDVPLEPVMIEKIERVAEKTE